jgi:hypothetical protein
MRAAILEKTGQPPGVGEFDEPDRNVVTIRRLKAWQAQQDSPHHKIVVAP